MSSETRLDDGCSWWFKKISDVERLESPSARLARRLVLNDPSSLSVRHLRSATAERPFRKSGTDGSNPVPSSEESANFRSLSGGRMILLFARPFPHCTLSAGQWQFGTPLPPSL